MTHLVRLIRHLAQFIYTLLMLMGDGGRYLVFRLRSPTALAAENLFLRKQLALYRERGIKPRRATPRHTSRADLARPLVRLASGLGRHAAGDVDPLASPGISPVLALDITTWTSPDPSGPASAHPSDGPGEPVMG